MLLRTVKRRQLHLRCNAIQHVQPFARKTSRAPHLNVVARHRGVAHNDVAVIIGAKHVGIEAVAVGKRKFAVVVCQCLLYLLASNEVEFGGVSVWQGNCWNTQLLRRQLCLQHEVGEQCAAHTRKHAVCFGYVGNAVAPFEDAHSRVDASQQALSTHCVPPNTSVLP